MKKYRGVFLKNEREIGLLREANRMVAMILDELGRQVRPGLPTMHFEEIVQNMCREFKVKPAFQGMYGFPYGLCCSVNEVIVHGFPSEDVILKEGDIVSFDVGTVYEGFYGDAARTFAVGDVSPEAARLLRVTEESLALAVAEARSGNELNDIAGAVQKHAEGARVPCGKTVCWARHRFDVARKTRSSQLRCDHETGVAAQDRHGAVY